MLAILWSSLKQVNNYYHGRKVSNYKSLHEENFLIINASGLLYWRRGAIKMLIELDLNVRWSSEVVMRTSSVANETVQHYGVTHRHSVAFLLTCLKFRKGIIDYFFKTRNSWRFILPDLRYNISHKDNECISQKPRSCGRICVTHRFAIKPPTTSNIKNGFQSFKFSIFFIITDKLLPPITGR